ALSGHGRRESAASAHQSAASRRENLLRPSLDCRLAQREVRSAERDPWPTASWPARSLGQGTAQSRPQPTLENLASTVFAEFRPAPSGYRWGCPANGAVWASSVREERCALPGGYRAAS